MPAASTPKLSVQVSDFEKICLLIQLARLVCDFCSSSQRFACGFLQIPPRDGHLCRPANDSPCRVRRRLSLPSECALPGAQRAKRQVLSAAFSTAPLLLDSQRLPGTTLNRWCAGLFATNDHQVVSVRLITPEAIRVTILVPFAIVPAVQLAVAQA